MQDNYIFFNYIRINKSSKKNVKEKKHITPGHGLQVSILRCAFADLIRYIYRGKSQKRHWICLRTWAGNTPASKSILHD